MERQDIQPLRNLPIEEVAERVGLEVIRHKALCPFHDDHHASLSFNTRRNTYRCFVCDAHGGTIDLVMQTLHKDFRQACAWLSNNSIEPHQTHSAHSPHKPFDASRYERFFQHPYLSPAARQFLFDQRRLDPRVVRWCRLTSWRDRDGIDWLQIPYYDRDGHLVGIQNRNLNYHPDPQPSTLNSSLLTPHSPRFRFPTGSRCGIYNLPVLNLLHEGEELWITEGASDCWSLLSAGHKAIAIPSATLLKPNALAPLLTLHSQLLTPFQMAPDRDEPGERLFLQLQRLLPNLTHHHLPPDCKDYSDYYIKVKSEK
ncbi:MAG: hypothetical protein K6D59_03135 [Bacteroidales bacterium]|nr:hypothetical protein [Bacteroidales bacterium]